MEGLTGERHDTLLGVRDVVTRGVHLAKVIELSVGLGVHSTVCKLCHKFFFN